MSIIDSFDPQDRPIIGVEDIYEKRAERLDACIINFSRKITDALLEDGLIEELAPDTIKSVSCDYPVYLYKGTNIGMVQTTVGAPVTAVLLQEIGHIFSCRRFVLFGSCGGLDRTIPPGKLIVPTHAYRDEGTSYHYAPPADYIEIKNHPAVCGVLDALGIEYVIGRTWTTDAFYRETEKRCNARKIEGCIAVEMELSACQAVADWCGVELYSFLYRADNLDSFKWEKGVLSSLPADERLKHFFVALEIAKEASGNKNECGN